MSIIRHKFNAKPTTIDEIKFSSKKESNRYLILNELIKNGEVLFFLRQVPFHIKGGIKYLCDFLVFWSNGEVTFEDVKGFKTDMYKMKKKLVESQYPIDIVEI